MSDIFMSENTFALFSNTLTIVTKKKKIPKGIN